MASIGGRGRMHGTLQIMPKDTFISVLIDYSKTLNLLRLYQQPEMQTREGKAMGTEMLVRISYDFLDDVHKSLI